MTLDELNPGDKGTIKKLSIKDKLGQRLMDMGIYPGLTLNVVWNAPWGSHGSGDRWILHQPGPWWSPVYWGGAQMSDRLLGRPGRPAQLREINDFQCPDRCQAACGQLSGGHRGQNVRVVKTWGDPGVGLWTIWSHSARRETVPDHVHQYHPHISVYLMK